MKFFQNLYKDTLNRFSFNIACWHTVLAVIFIFVCFLVLAIYFENTNIETTNTAGLITLMYSIFLFFPCYIINNIYFYTYLRKKEKRYQNFRIKNKFITENTIYKVLSSIIFVLSIIFSILFIVLFIIYHFKPILIGILLYLPVIIIVLFINLLISKFILDKIIDKKFG